MQSTMARWAWQQELETGHVLLQAGSRGGDGGLQLGFSFFFIQFGTVTHIQGGSSLHREAPSQAH